MSKQGRISSTERRRRRPATSRSAGSARVPESPASLPRRLSPRKPPTQDRSRATVEAILGAAIDLLSSRGYARTSTNLIAARAGVSVGSLYQYFPNKDAIATALFERHAAGIERIVEAAFEEMRRPDVPLRNAFRRMLLAFEELHEADPKMALAVAPLADGRMQLAAAVGRREEHFRERLADVLRHRPDVRPGNRPLMASLLFDVVEAVIRSLMHGDARRFERAEALDEAVEAICGYVVEARRADCSGPS